MSVLAWLHRVLLRLYPRSFRDEYGADMTATFLDTVRSRPTTAARAMFVAHAVTDAVASAAAERADERRRSRSHLTPHRYEPSFGRGVQALQWDGVAAHGVNRRLGEIGIRIALGAQRWDIARTVLDRSGVAVVVGAAAGSLGAAFASQALQRFLFTVTPRDPVSFLGALVVTVVAAILACWLPARRAMAVDPMAVIRE